MGARGNGRVEIVSGLREGEIVVPTTLASIHEGSAVRAEAQRTAHTQRT